VRLGRMHDARLQPLVLDSAHLVVSCSSLAWVRTNPSEPMAIEAIAQTGEPCSETVKALLSPEQTAPSVQCAEYKFYYDSVRYQL
jgi:hypothetical protein